MVKVIQPAERDKWRVTCHFCKAVLEFEKEDIYIANTAVHYAGETWEPEARIECPECESPVKVTDRISHNMFNKLCGQARKPQ